MRILMTVRFPTEKFNSFVKDGTAGAKIEKILQESKAEASYFTEFGGRRTALIIVDLPRASAIPALAEPWFLTFDAEVEFRPVMLPEDLKNSGIEKMGKR